MGCVRYGPRTLRLRHAGTMICPHLRFCTVLGRAALRTAKMYLCPLRRSVVCWGVVWVWHLHALHIRHAFPRGHAQGVGAGGFWRRA